jgi:hypothetical protein
LRGEAFGLNRSVRPEDCAVRGLYTELDGSKIDASSAQDLDYLRLENDAAPAAVEIMGRALEDDDVPADSAQKVAGEEPAEGRSVPDTALSASWFGGEGMPSAGSRAAFNPHF